MIGIVSRREAVKVKVGRKPRRALDAMQIPGIRAGFEPSVARIIVDDYTVSCASDRSIFRRAL
jgi:hypothetical protein